MKIGIIGGGQLGMMMAEQAKILGHTIMSLDPSPSCSITHFSDCHISKSYNDKEALEFMYESCDVLTYEFENVDLEVFRPYLDKLPQGIEALRMSKNRFLEKEFASDLKIDVPRYNKVRNIDDIFSPSIVKTLTGGYDGKGQYKVLSEHDIKKAITMTEQPLICEEYIPFDYEISVIASRSKDGKCVFFPIPVNIHKNGILHMSIVDDSVPKDILNQAEDNTQRILEELDYVGTLAVEYFVKDGRVLFNEFAPRPHNSGHYTMEGCNLSQFKAHILAITGETIPNPHLINKTIMINVLGQNKKYYRVAREIDNAFIHDYYKSSNRANRKIGHINLVFNNKDNIQQILDSILKE